MSATSISATSMPAGSMPSPAGPVTASAAELEAAVARLASAASTSDAIEIARTSVRQLIGSDGIALVLRDGDHCHYVEEDAVGPLWKGKRFPMTSCISGWSMQHRQTVAISDIFRDQRIPHELYRVTFVRSLVMAPIVLAPIVLAPIAMAPIGQAEPVGALGAYWRIPYEPNLAEIETVERLARALAGAIGRAYGS